MKFIKIANPLPPANYDAVKDDDQRRVDYMKRGLDKNIPYDKEDPEGKLDFLGVGSYGIAYQPQDKNKVVKYTTDHVEVEVADKIMKMQEQIGGFLPHVVGVYGFETINDAENKGAYRLVLEKVQSLNDLERKIGWELHNYYPFILKKDLTQKMFLERLNDLEGNEKEIQDFAQEYLRTMQWLHDKGLKPEDLNGDNIGRRENGQLVALDLGFY